MTDRDSPVTHGCYKAHLDDTLEGNFGTLLISRSYGPLIIDQIIA
jgi:hypothetical protein